MRRFVHPLPKCLTTMENKQYTRIRNLPENEREPFRKWIDGQTRPLMENETMDAESQDAYYEHDYQAWKRGGGVWD